MPPECQQLDHAFQGEDGNEQLVDVIERVRQFLRLFVVFERHADHVQHDHYHYWNVEMLIRNQLEEEELKLQLQNKAHITQYTKKFDWEFCRCLSMQINADITNAYIKLHKSVIDDTRIKIGKIKEPRKPKMKKHGINVQTVSTKITEIIQWSSVWKLSCLSINQTFMTLDSIICYIIIIYFQNVHFFHAQLGLDIFPDMRPLHISLNTAHSGCKPNSSVSSFTHSLQVFLPLPIYLTPATR